MMESHERLARALHGSKMFDQRWPCAVLVDWPANRDVLASMGHRADVWEYSHLDLDNPPADCILFATPEAAHQYASLVGDAWIIEPTKPDIERP